MPEVLVRWSALGAQADSLESCAASLESCADSVARVRRALALGETALLQYRHQLKSIGTQLELQKSEASSLGAAVNNACGCYLSAEQQINGNAGGAPIDVPEGTGGTADGGSWWDKLQERFKDAYDTITDGAADTVSDIQDTAAAWILDYVNKGNVYKIVKTVEAGGAIVASVVGIVGIWTGDVFSCGAATGFAVVDTVYGVNTITSSVADIKNCWWGDVEKVGKVDLLKSGNETVMGNLSEMLGFDRDAGKKAGDFLYGAGSLSSAAYHIGTDISKLEQSPDLLESLKNNFTEVRIHKDGAEATDIDYFTHGIGKLVTDTNLKDLGLQGKLLKMEVPSLTDTYDTLKTSKDVFENAKKFVDTREDLSANFEGAN